jgi:DNA-binding MarR family transcriptional regulator
LDNHREIVLALTDKGRVAYDGHEKYHRVITAKHFAGLPDAKIDVFMEILIHIERFVDSHLENA